MTLRRLERKTKGQGQRMPSFPFSVSVHFHGKKHEVNGVSDGVSGVHTPIQHLTFASKYMYAFTFASRLQGHKEQFIFKTCHLAGGVARGPGLQSCTSFQGFSDVSAF